MSVVIETTLGDFTVDLYLTERPRACLNFLKLCKIKYYNLNLFHMVNHGFIAQTGDPTGSGDGGESIWGVLEGSPKRYFQAETAPRIKHTKLGLVSFVGDTNNMLCSQFFITLAPDLTYLDAQHNVFGEIVEGLENLYIFNETICDNNHRPYQDIRITHTVVLDDPFPDPDGLVIPCSSPEPTAERLKGGRIAPDEEFDENVGKSATEIAETIADREAKARATILEMVGDIPDAEMAPPENVLFICKLNPVTNDDDLEIIFSRFGKIKSCEVIRDKKTGDSLQYAFVEFDNPKACEDAYFKMDNVLIDDRRIHVDFSQSVAKVRWYGKGRIAYEGDSKNNLGKGKYEKINKRNKNPADERKYKVERKDSSAEEDVLKNERYNRSSSVENRKYRRDKYSPPVDRTYRNERSNRSSSVENKKYRNDRRDKHSPGEDRNYKNEKYSRSSPMEERTYRNEKYNRSSPTEDKTYRNEKYNRSSPTDDRTYKNEKYNRSSPTEDRTYKNERYNKSSPTEDRTYKNERYNRSSPTEDRTYKNERYNRSSPAGERTYRNERYRSSSTEDRKYKRKERFSPGEGRKYKNEYDSKYSRNNDWHRPRQIYKYNQDNYFKSNRKYYDRRVVQYNRNYPNYKKFNNDRDREYDRRVFKYKSERRYDDKTNDRAEYKKYTSTRSDRKSEEYKKQKKKKKRKSSSSDDSDS